MKEHPDISYNDAIEQVLLHNGYVAPLKLIYIEIWKYKNKDAVKGKTPDFTIQAILQRDKRYTRVGLGIYALTEFLDKLPKVIQVESKATVQEKRHASIQGMLLEIGNSRREVHQTYTNDKKWIFQNKPLSALATLKIVPLFTYPHIIEHSVKFIDVIWFNKRGFPCKVFEVENSTDFRDALVKFAEMQDFKTSFVCVALEGRKEKFERELRKSAFSEIRSRCEFVSYEQVEHDYKVALQNTYL